MSVKTTDAFNRQAMLVEYDSAKEIRPATDEEYEASCEAARRDGGAGVIRVDGRRCYVL